MSPIGRVFILLNFVLAGAFLGWASVSLAKSEEYKGQFEDEREAHEATRAELESRLSQLQTELETEQRAKESLRAERDQAKGTADRNLADLNEQKRSNDQLTADIAAIRETLVGYRESIDSLTQAKDRAVQEARDAETARRDAEDARDQAEAARRDAADAAVQAEAQIAQLEKTLTEARGRADSLDTQLATIVEQYNIPIGDVLAERLIEGSVLSFDASIQPGLVALNVGSNAQVERGYTFEIYRGTTWKGTVRVQNVRPDMCTALVIRTVPGAQIQQGDRAATRL